jgi:methylglutaconyl-CoA hydratase
MIRCDVDQRGVATLTLDRPDKHNAYSQAILDALSGEIARLGADLAVRLLVLRGSGRSFCAGAEIGAQESATKETRTDGPPLTIAGVCQALDTIPKPAIAIVQGACIGGGVALVCACDMVIAARDAFFAMPEVRLGFAPGPLIPFFLRAMEPRSLRRYLLSGERFAAAEAHRIGLVHELCDADALDATLARVVDEALLAGPNATAEAKRLLRDLQGKPATTELIAALQIAFEKGFHSPEAWEGRASFREKRKPAWVWAEKKPQ